MKKTDEPVKKTDEEPVKKTDGEPVKKEAAKEARAQDSKTVFADQVKKDKADQKVEGPPKKAVCLVRRQSITRKRAARQESVRNLQSTRQS